MAGYFYSVAEKKLRLCSRLGIPQTRNPTQYAKEVGSGRRATDCLKQEGCGRRVRGSLC